MATTSSRPSVRDRIRPVEAGEAVISAHFLKTTAVLTLASGEIVLAGEDDRRVTLHEGGLLASADDGQSLLTGGDDGKVVLFDIKDGARTVHEGRAWIDRVAMAPGGGLAWSAGRKAFAVSGRGPKELAAVKSLDIVSAVGGLAFFPKGFRLAVAHYNGVSLWYPNSEAKPQFLEWKGSHLGVAVSPDQRFVVTTMQEPQLHGWRLEDGQHMRMSGYPGKVKSFGWTTGGKFLATSGATEAILWPFSAKNGPMGAQPTMIAPGAKAGVRVTQVAGHPSSPVVAVGFADGLILLARIEDGAEILAREPDGDPVSAIAWRADGKGLVYGTEGGKAGLAAL